ncbi:MAG: cytochrome-c oxidase, cbb3-type subunit I [Phycisphaerales bacterium]|jgi:cytochrome c oxidase cbb3-type subunit I/II|nr:cytochrome-c oxidase, cbb3-type subunit I [Phycisphaerales bacterium]
MSTSPLDPSVGQAAGATVHEHAPEGGHAAPRSGLDEFTYDDGIVRLFFWATMLWGIVALLVGVVLAFELAVPQLNMHEWVTFGRLRPLHTNAAIFAFAGNAIFAAVYYSTQRLCKCRMWSDVLSRMHFWGWQLIIVSAAITLPLGITQSKEYAELEWPIDLAIAVVWLGFFGTNFLMTLVRRRERHLYVALWFYIATIVTVTMLHVFNNLWIPVGVYELFTTGHVSGPEQLMKSYPVYAGVQDAFMQWWYGHNAVAFFLTTPFLGLMYYFLPKAADRPVFSYKLSIVHFWSLVFIYIWAGPHHLHYTALPEWASSLGMLFSVMLWMPSWGGMINGLLTLRGAWHKVASDPVLKFFVVGITFYGMSTFEGPLLSVKTVNMLSHYTDWTIAHVHSGTLGWNGFMIFGMAYWLAPRLFQTKGLFSVKLATTHFWISTIGILLYVISMYTAGVTQGLMWRAFDDTGTLQYPQFIETVTRLVPFYWIRAVGGTLYLAGAILGLVNLILTWSMRPRKYETPIQRVAPLSRVYEDDPMPASRLSAVVELGHKGDVWLQGAWHRRMERLPVRFTIWVVIAVATASLFEIIPTFLIKSNVPTIATVQPYTPLELAGRDVYIAEGCYNCHSQMIRPIFAEVERYGEYSKAGEFVYDHPFQWGSRRIGPDLAREGVPPNKKSTSWHVQHFLEPPVISPGSVMPPYPHLATTPLNFEAIQARVGTMAMLGVPYGEAVKDGFAVELARAQAKALTNELVSEIAANDPNADLEPYRSMEDKKIIALVAYLQRMGTDLTRPEGEVVPYLRSLPTPATAEGEVEDGTPVAMRD